MEERLKLIREKSGLSQRKFSEKVGVHFRTIQTYEKDASALSVSIAKKIASMFNINLIWFLTGHGSMVPGETSTESTPSTMSTPSTQPHAEIVEFGPVVTKHIEVVKQFQDKEAALVINQDLLDIERAAPEVFKKAVSYVKGLKDAVEAIDPLSKKTNEKATESGPWDGTDRRKSS